MHETLDELLHRRPFKPFELCMSNGNSYIVRHPEFAQLMKTKIVIGMPETGKAAICFLLHVSDIRFL
jgi:hypothetical protein